MSGPSAVGKKERGPYGLLRDRPGRGRDIPVLTHHYGPQGPQGYPSVSTSIVFRSRDRGHTKVYATNGSDTDAPIVKRMAGWDRRFDLDSIPEHTSGGPVTRGPWQWKPRTDMGPCVMETG